MASEKLTRLCEGELAALIQMSTRNNTVNLHYGIGWVAVGDGPGDQWVLAEICRIRGIDPK